MPPIAGMLASLVGLGTSVFTDNQMGGALLAAADFVAEFEAVKAEVEGEMGDQS